MTDKPDTPQEIGDGIGRSAVWHLDQMYPSWKDVLPRSARSSLKNFIALSVASAIEDDRAAREGSADV